VTKKANSDNQFGRDYFVNMDPKKSGRYTVLYSRAKSKEVKHGTAHFRTRTRGDAKKGWDDIKSLAGRSVNASFDSRDILLYQPTVLAWSNG
jgi:hypothetical protein